MDSDATGTERVRGSTPVRWRGQDLNLRPSGYQRFADPAGRSGRKCVSPRKSPYFWLGGGIPCGPV